MSSDIKNEFEEYVKTLTETICNDIFLEKLEQILSLIHIYAAGIQPGDIITGIDGNMVLSIQAFSEKLYQCESGQQISITAKRFGGDEYKDMTFNAVIAVK